LVRVDVRRQPLAEEVVGQPTNLRRPPETRRRSTALRRPLPGAGRPPRPSGRGGAEEEDRDGEDPAEVRELPVVWGRLGDADQPGHPQIEHAECVNLTDAQMNAQRRRRDHPAAEPRFGDRPRSKIEPRIIGERGYPARRLLGADRSGGSRQVSIPVRWADIGQPRPIACPTPYANPGAR
jgi:hypothetical protein